MSTEATYADGVLTLRRIYNAPREAVFDAWVETSKVERWWGCGQTTRVRSAVEPHIGGKYHHLMTHEVAGDIPMEGEFTEFDPPAALAYRVADVHTGQTMEVRVEFIERGSATEIVLTHRGAPAELKDIIIGGWSAAFDKLDRVVTEEAA